MVAVAVMKSSSVEVPDCRYLEAPVLVRPKFPAKRHSLRLSSLDDQKFLRFSIKYLYVYRKCPGADALREALSWVLADYYPLAGRLRVCDAGGDSCGERLEVDCNGEGAVFAEGSVGISADEFLEGAAEPNRSWRKLLYRVDAQSLVDVPPLVVQVTHLSCGGMILCMAINHSVCDGVGSSNFLRAWSHYASTRPPSAAAAVTAPVPVGDLPVAPFHNRLMLMPRLPLKISCSQHREFTPSNTGDYPDFDLTRHLLSQPLAPVSVTFFAEQILLLKQQCIPSLKCTSFEALAAHVWRSWVRALTIPAGLQCKLLFSVNVREKMSPPLPEGFYGNGFVLGCAEAPAEKLAAAANLRGGVELVQEGKRRLDDEYVRSMVDFLEGNRGVKPDLSASLVISQWSKLGLEEVDFGAGRPTHMGPLASEIYCLFLPVVGDVNAFNVLLSVPESAADRLVRYLKDCSGEEEKNIKENGRCFV